MQTKHRFRCPEHMRRGSCACCVLYNAFCGRLADEFRYRVVSSPYFVVAAIFRNACVYLTIGARPFQRKFGDPSCAATIGKPQPCYFPASADFLACHKNRFQKVEAAVMRSMRLRCMDVCRHASPRSFGASVPAQDVPVFSTKMHTPSARYFPNAAFLLNPTFFGATSAAG